MNIPTIQAFGGRERLAERGRAARQALRRAAAVAAVLFLGRALPAMGWAGMLVQ